MLMESGNKTLSRIIPLFLSLGILFAGSLFAANSNAPSELGWKFAYDDDGRIRKVIDVAGRTTGFQYELDAKDRLRMLIRTADDGSSVILRFDESGQRTSMHDSLGTVSYGYDDMGRLTKVQREDSPAVAYAYDTFDRIQVLQVGDFYRIEYKYDYLGRLESMKTPAGIVKYDYVNGQGTVIRSLPNGIKTHLDFESNGELRRITHNRSNSPGDNNYQVLAEYSYRYRPDGLIESIKEQGVAGQAMRTYRYDEVGRIVKTAGRKGRGYTYEYDPVGNRLTTQSSSEAPMKFTYDWAGRLTSFDGAPVEHDAAGNLTAINVDGSTKTYSYNQSNQLVGALDGKVSYRYDGEGNLIWRKTGRAETSFLPDSLAEIWRPLMMEDNEGHRTLVVWDGSTPLMIIQDGKPEYLLHDHLGSVRLLVDDRGGMLQQFDYDAFGTLIVGSKGNIFAPRFAGLFWDSDAGVYHTRARNYSPELSRFIQRDPKNRIPNRDSESHSQYAYCANDPINYVDLNGQERTAIIKSDHTLDLFELYAADRQLTVGNSEWSNSPNAWHNLNIFSSYQADRYLVSHPVERSRSIIQAEIRQLVDWQVKHDFPHQDHKGYLQCGEWQELVYRALSSNAEIAANWDVLPYAEFSSIDGIVRVVSGGSKRHYGHFFVAVRSKSDGTMYKIDPWRSGIRRHINIGPPHNDFITGRAADLVPFKPDKNLHREVFSNEGLESFQPLTQPRQNTHSHPAFQPNLDLPSSKSNINQINTQRMQQSLIMTDVIMGQIDAAKQVVQKYDISGGGGRVAGPGGVASPDSYTALHEFRQLLPSPASTVGGVYLGGAGRALESIGLIEGVSLDANNNLILLSKTGDQIDLPPLRIDDVVTVFRSVYPIDESTVPTGPTVSIDPNPKDPQGSAMLVRHSKATEDTYVGWVLFQADRIMKGYTLGKDNETTEDVKSTVPDYDKVQNTLYFGQKSGNRKGDNWERFWIVPAEVRQFSAKNSQTTLIEVPLKVKTQTMKWVNGELVDDLKRKSSPGASAFTKWFTTRYDEIAEEQYLKPPSESGIDEPVPVFAELRRIALITAIAEKLRNQGVPMPFWMRDYEVRRVPIDKFTPGLRVTRSNHQMTARVHGGVLMLPNVEDVKVFNPVTNLDHLPRQEQKSVRSKVNSIEALQKAVRDEMIAAEPLEVRQFTEKETGYRAVSMPGSETKALAPATMVEADLSVFIEGGHSIQLPRFYHSFFSPNGLWGKGWTMNLPRLNKLAWPIYQSSGEVEYRTVHELITPLNSYRTLFSRVEKVPELNNSQLQVPDQPAEFFGLANSKPTFLTGETTELIRKDGGSWHFSGAGDLVAVDKDGFRTVYERDGSSRITRIAGMLGGRLMATIVLNYYSSGKLSSAIAANVGKESVETTIDYTYDDSGMLTGIQSKAGKLVIRYEGSLVSTVIYRANSSDGNESTDLVLRSFEYGSNGQLSSETDVAGNKTIYSLKSDSSGSTITVSSNKDSGESYTRYDPSFKPLEAKYDDGSLVTWEYPDSGESIMSLKDTDGFGIRLTESNDQRQRVMEFDDRYKIKSEFDSAGRLISMSENGNISMEQEWTPLGQLRMARFENYVDHFEYDQNGLISRVIRAPPGEKGNFSQVLETRFDPFGRPVEVRGSSGIHLQASYDAKGKIVEMFDRSPGRNYDIKIDRDQLDRIQQIRTPWESQQYAYDDIGQIASLKIDREGADASVEWMSGLLQSVRHFDGGKSTFNYYDAPEKKGLLKSITAPNQLIINYEYGPDNELRRVNVGDLYKLSLDYDTRGNLTSWSWIPGHAESERIVPDEKLESSSPVTLDRAMVAIKERRSDIMFASKGVHDVMVLDHSFVEGDARLLLAINGKVKTANPTMAAEFDKLLKVTVNIVGPVDQLQGRWDSFVDKYLTGISKSRNWMTHDRREVTLKPRLIIKSTQTNYKYTNLERIRALTGNFNIYVTHNPNVTATSLVKKIRNLPRLSTDNLLFVFRLPDMEMGMRQRWQAAITELQQVVGPGNVHYDPSKQELEAATSARDKEVVVLEFAHTEDGIVLKDNEVYQSVDIERGGSLTHVKYMLGLSCCNLPQLENGKFLRALQTKGIGIVHGSARAVDADIGLKRLRQLIEMLKYVDHYRLLPMDYVQDVIDQMQNIDHQGMIKVGRRSDRYWDLEYPTV